MLLVTIATIHQRTVGITQYHRYSVYCVSSKNISGMDSNATSDIFTSKIGSGTKEVQAKQQYSQLLQSLDEQQPRNYSTNILVVDDEPDTLFTYESFLSDEGYSVKTFTDSREALKHLVQLPEPSSYYQLVLLDIRMPRINGLQLFHRIKAISPNIKIMFISALDIAEELTSILPNIKYGDIIKKPVQREYFINRIKSALNQ